MLLIGHLYLLEIILNGVISQELSDRYISLSIFLNHFSEARVNVNVLVAEDVGDELAELLLAWDTAWHKEIVFFAFHVDQYIKL